MSRQDPSQGAARALERARARRNVNSPLHVFQVHVCRRGVRVYCVMLDVCVRHLARVLLSLHSRHRGGGKTRGWSWVGGLLVQLATGTGTDPLFRLWVFPFVATLQVTPSGAARHTACKRSSPAGSPRKAMSVIIKPAAGGPEDDVYDPMKPFASSQDCPSFEARSIAGAIRDHGLVVGYHLFRPSPLPPPPQSPSAGEAKCIIDLASLQPVEPDSSAAQKKKRGHLDVLMRHDPAPLCSAAAQALDAAIASRSAMDDSLQAALADVQSLCKDAKADFQDGTPANANRQLNRGMGLMRARELAINHVLLCTDATARLEALDSEWCAAQAEGEEARKAALRQMVAIDCNLQV